MKQFILIVMTLLLVVLGTLRVEPCHEEYLVFMPLMTRNLYKVYLPLMFWDGVSAPERESP